MILSRAMDRLVDRQLRREKRFVGVRARYIVPALVAGSLIVAIHVAHVLGGAWEWIAWVAVGWPLGAWVMTSTTRGLSYRRGYHDGRRQMFESIQESMRRGTPFQFWMLGEMERTLALARDEHPNKDGNAEVEKSLDLLEEIRKDIQSD